MRDERQIACLWVAKARSDLLNADNNLAATVIPADTVCFHCQQAAEKLLKAAMAAQGVPPPRTHVLMLLADQLASTLPSIEQLGDELAILTPYAVAIRYPDDDFDMPAIEDAREARECADKVFAWLRKEFPDLAEEER